MLLIPYTNQRFPTCSPGPHRAAVGPGAFAQPGRSLEDVEWDAGQQTWQLGHGSWVGGVELVGFMSCVCVCDSLIMFDCILVHNSDARALS